MKTVKLMLVIEPLCADCAGTLTLLLPKTFPMAKLYADKSQSTESACVRCKRKEAPREPKP